MTKTLCALVALLALVAAGCGSSSGGSGSDTAKLAPASSFLYAEATIDPTGSQEAGMRSILGDLPGSGPPARRLDNLIQKAAKSDKSAKVDYLHDVKPWLGDKAAVFVASPKAGVKSPPWGVVVATTDEGKAKATIRKGKEPGDKERSYDGSDYLLSSDTAVGTVKGFLVIGSEAGFKAAVDAAKSGSLSASDRYKEATKRAASERVALVYEDLGGLLQTVANSSGQSLGPAAPLVGRLFGGKPVVATVKAENQALVIDGSLVPASSGLDFFGKSTPLLGEVPGDSWLVVGQPDFGGTVKSMIGLFAGMVGGEQALAQQLKAATGLDLEQDLLAWMGDVALFADGNSKDSIGGGALIESKDPKASQRALTKLAALAARSGQAQVSVARFGDADGFELKLKSAPRGVYMLQKGDRVAITYGDAAAKAALGVTGGGALQDASGFKDATGKLGGAYSPSLYVAVPPILGLAESFGAGGADYRKARPYLTILDYVVAGAAKSGDTANSRTRIGFKPHE